MTHELDISQCELVMVGEHQVESVDLGDHRVYPGKTYLYTDTRVEATPWEYTIGHSEGYRVRTETTYAWDVYSDDSTSEQQEVGREDVRQNGVQSVGAWAYNWTTNGSSTRTQTITYTFSDATKTIDATQTGGELVIRLTNISNTIAANGTGAYTAKIVSENYWPSASGGSIISTTDLTGVSITAAGGFVASVNGSNLSVTRGNNTTTSEQRGALSGSKSGYSSLTDYGASYQVVQPAGAIQYGAWTGSGGLILSAPNLAASGGSATAQIKVDRSWTWNGVAGSGSTESSTGYVTALSGSATGFSISGYTVTAASRGTTAGAARSIQLTGTYQGVSATGTITQALNQITNTSAGTPVIKLSANPTTLSAAANQSSAISCPVTRTDTYTWSSGSTSNTGEQSIGTASWTVSGTGFSKSGNNVVTTANTAYTSRSATVTATYSGASSKSITITQQAKVLETVKAKFYIAGGDPMSIIGINVYTAEGVFVSYAELGGGLGGGLDDFGQDVPVPPGPMLIRLSGDQPRDVQYYDSSGSGGVTVTKSGDMWLVSGPYLDYHHLNQIVFAVFR